MKKIINTLCEFAISAGYFLIMLPGLILFFTSNRKLFKNNIITVFYQTSFGQNITFLDSISRHFYPHRISVIYLHSNLSNKFLPECFSHNLDIFRYTPWPLKNGILPRLTFIRRCSIIKKNFNNILHFLRILWGGFQIIETPFFCVSTLSLTETEILYGKEELGKTIPSLNYTGYFRLIRDKIGINPSLPQTLADKCRSAIQNKYPDFFRKPFVTLSLRIKGDLNFDDNTRNGGSQENYIEAIRHIISRGYNVVGAKERESGLLYNSIPGYFQFSDLKGIDQQILNLFIIMNSALFIGQHSGPQNLAVTAGVPILLTDALPYFHGTFNPSNLILRKKLKNTVKNETLSIVDIYCNHPDLAYHYNFTKKGIQVINNTSEEILLAVKESLDILENKLILSDMDKKLINAYNRLPYDKGMMIYYERNRPPLFELYKIRDELLPFIEQEVDKIKRRELYVTNQ
jgi:putative glycosyltransferase (TIGR04372 family)